MNGDDNFYYYNPETGEPEEPDQDDSPASVVFMEMMRQAADRHNDENPVLRQPDYTQYELQGDAINAQHDAERPEREAALEAQRQQREQRRKARRRRQTVGMIGGLFRAVIVVVISGGLIATILIANATQLPSVLPTLAPTLNWMRRIGILSGHRGPEDDPGAVCDDGLTEAEINFAVAERLVILLRGEGYTVDLLEEFDEQLTNYAADVFVSIHANDCSDYGEFVSGYLVAHAEARPEGGQDTRLRECLATHYQTATGLDRHFGLTPEMQDYHAFRKIGLVTPAVIFELGFMRGDRELLTTRQDAMAQGLFNGILCFLQNEDVPPPTIPTPTEVTVQG